MLCDHSKLGHDVGWRANLTLATVLEQAKSFLIISTYPDESDHSRAKVDQQVEAFRILIADLAKEMNSNPEHIFQGKEIALRLVNEYGEVVKEISLNENLVKADKAFLGAAVFPSQLKRAER